MRSVDFSTLLFVLQELLRFVGGYRLSQRLVNR